MKKFLIYFVMIAIAASLMIGCSSNKAVHGSDELISGNKNPKWVDEPEKASTKKEKAFIGVSRQFSMEQDARSDARRDAYKQAVEALGVYVKSKVNEVVSSVNMSDNILSPAVVRDELSRIEAAGITVGNVKEYHLQKYKKMDNDKVSYYYVAYCQYLVDRNYTKQVMENMVKKQKELTDNEKDKVQLDRALEKIKELDTSGF